MSRHQDPAALGPYPILPEGLVRTIIDPEAHAVVTPVDEAFTWIRANAPLAQASIEGFDPFWVVSRHHDIQWISTQPALFSSGQRSLVVMSQAEGAMIRERTGTPHRLYTMLHMDGPDHLRQRAITQKWFMPAGLGPLAERVRDLARMQARRLSDFGGKVDFAAEIAGRFPFHVIMEMMGVPLEEEETFRRITAILLAPKDETANPSLAGVGDDQKTAAVDASFSGILDEYARYFTELSAARAHSPANDITTVIAAACADGNLTPAEAIAYFTLLIGAGYATTAYAIAAGMQQLCADSYLLHALRTSPELIDAFVDESLRWSSPARHFMRTATQDVDISGVQVKQGDWLMLCYPSGNRDELVFQKPFEFRLDRGANPHLAFGAGAHKCLGLHLARLEMRTLWQELIPRLGQVFQAGPVSRSRSAMVSGLQSLPIVYQLID